MFKLTDQELTEDILQAVNIVEFIKVAGKKIGKETAEKKIKRSLNEFYQYHPKTHYQVNKGNYSKLQEIVNAGIYNWTYVC